MKKGLLIINLGTPNLPTFKEVSVYLAQFLTDERVIDINPLVRYLLVYVFILPFRTRASTHAYQSIWTSLGSPLLHHSQDLSYRLQQHLKDSYKVSLAMRYGSPSIKEGLLALQDCESLTILPLYPQYSSAATGSSIGKTMHELSSELILPSLRIIRDFYQHPSYIKAQAALIKPYLRESHHLLLSYHGLPQRQIIKAGCAKVCTGPCPSPEAKNINCYKAQCYATSRALANILELDSKNYTTTFQSRLGRVPWIRPYTDEMLKELSLTGVKNLVVVCPSFVTDCLETLEEIGIRARNQWQLLGGESFTLVPSMNTHSLWIDALTDIISLP